MGATVSKQAVRSDEAAKKSKQYFQKVPVDMYEKGISQLKLGKTAQFLCA